MLLMAIGSFRFTNNSSLLKLHLIFIVFRNMEGALRFKVHAKVYAIKMFVLELQ
jgi:hypothetical protein